MNNFNRRPNLIILSKVRSKAQKIKNEGFKREYQNIIKPVLEKIRRYRNDDHILYNDVKNAIKQIESIARTYQYIPFNPKNIGKGTTVNDFSDHSNLYEIEKLCQYFYYNYLDIVMKIDKGYRISDFKKKYQEK